MRPSRILTAVSAAAILPSLFAVTAGSAAAAGPTGTRVSDVREIDPGNHYTLSPELQNAQRSTARAAATAAAAGVTPAVGTVRRMLALDDFKGFYYRKDYTLRAVGAKIEVWVASGSDATSTGTAFPAGDCRSTVAGTTDVTDAQAQLLADQFDNNMFPKESAAFSVAPARDGANALISGDYSGAGDKIVTLVDNVRDDNFYDFPAAPTYIAGFFSSAITELMDRNVMTIDAFDWLHRTGAAPADQPTADLCTSRPARPYLYEGVFAHEYQHLLESYTDPAEVSFVNEGLSDFAETLTGYANSNATVFQAGSQSHLYCFNGFGTVTTPYNTNPRDCGGPQNSLTIWGDEGSGSEILADYGNAWSFMLYLYDHYGLSFMSGLHNDGAAQGLPGVQAQLDAFAKGTKVYDVVHNYQLMNLLDAAVGAREGQVSGAARAKVTSASLTASLNLDNPTSYAIPGASPNGADYVRLRNAAGRTIRPEELRSLSFTGATSLPPQQLLWTVAAAPPGGATSSALWSGNSTNLDSAAVTQVSVPTTNPTLTFNELHQAEAGYDYAYTVVSTDGGKTYTPLANANTVAGPYGPSLNGVATAFATQTFDLSAYAGQTILVGFRYVSDGGVNEGGWYVDDVTVGATLISDGSSLTPFRSPTQISPTQVANWDVRLVGLDAVHHKALVQDYNGKTSFSLTRAQLKKFEDYPMVVAVVAYDDPTEQVQQFAGYKLVANGVTQPGG
jgi:Immune inhibitor A peptidase M6